MLTSLRLLVPCELSQYYVYPQGKGPEAQKKDTWRIKYTDYSKELEAERLQVDSFVPPYEKKPKKKRIQSETHNNRRKSDIQIVVDRGIELEDNECSESSSHSESSSIPLSVMTTIIRPSTETLEQPESKSTSEDDESSEDDSSGSEGEDIHDDVCFVCGEGGELICCDGCPRTYHKHCIPSSLPPCICEGPGDEWYCETCAWERCFVCGRRDKKLMLKCCNCGMYYHPSCDGSALALRVGGIDPYNTDNVLRWRRKQLEQDIKKSVGHNIDLSFLPMATRDEPR
ncbi:hypothetical protein ADUPG1_010019, partial [Aduncisulcus paluster]